MQGELLRAKRMMARHGMAAPVWEGGYALGGELGGRGGAARAVGGAGENAYAETEQILIASGGE